MKPFFTTAIVAALVFVSYTALAGKDTLVLRGTVGAATTETAEVILVNRCNKAVTAEISGIDVFTQDGDDRLFAEKVDLTPGETLVLPIPLPDPSATRDRRHVDLAVGYPRCRGALVVAVAVMDSAGQQVARSAGLRSDGELVQAVSEKPIRRTGHPRRGTGDLLRIGAGQAAEIVVVNRCRIEIAYRVLTRNIDPDEEEPIVSETEVLLAPGDGAVIPLDDGHKNWIDVISVGQQINRPGTSRSARSCSPGLVDASITVFNSNGGTQQVALLPPAVQAAREAAR